MAGVVNIANCFEQFADTFSPKIVGELNGQHILLVRCEGDKVPWHTHDREDEMFLVLEGALDILLRDASAKINPGEFYIVPKGTEHRVVPQGHVKLLLFEPAGIAHTGKVRAEITKDTFDRLE
ncbi:MAG: cupin domain-containing protein [candidate division Zixibacteria bacterium]|nr:cupin domain-containing protein [candidate division Zixibacteria bacterium]